LSLDTFITLRDQVSERSGRLAATHPRNYRSHQTHQTPVPTLNIRHKFRLDQTLCRIRQEKIHSTHPYILPFHHQRYNWSNIISERWYWNGFNKKQFSQ